MTTADDVSQLSPADSQRLHDEAMAAYQQSAASGELADYLLAQSEIVHAVARAGRELAEGRDQLAAANKQLASALARYQPVADQLDQVAATVAALPDGTEDADGDDLDTVPVEERVSSRSYRAALAGEHTRLERAAAQRQEAMRNAEELIRSAERDLLPGLERAYSVACSALANPPLNDFPLLGTMAPVTVQRRAGRLGTALLLAASAGGSPQHIAMVQVLIEQMLGMCGALKVIRDGWLRELLGKVDVRTQRAIHLALNPPDLTALPPGNPDPGQIRRSIQNGRENDLPPTGSPEAQRQNAELSASYREFGRRQQRDQLW